MSSNESVCPLGNISSACNWHKTPGKIRDENGTGMIECLTCELKKHEIDLRHKVNYESGSMHIWTEGYGEELVGPSLDKSRRINLLKESIRFDPLISILDFGCGNGEMLEILKTVVPNVMGLEPDAGARDQAEKRGFKVVGSINDLLSTKLTFDVITLFHVIEHIYEPLKLLFEIKALLNPGGKIIIETPNSQDVLITLYESNSFRDFTYWSHHPYLYSNLSLGMLVESAGLELISNGGVQRYSIDNHMYWLSKGLPGGHEIWNTKFDEELKNAYNKNLVDRNIQDTLWLVARNPSNSN